MALALVVLGAIGWILYARSQYKAAASCANCRTFVCWILEEYAKKNGGWYPRGGSTPMDSLAKCVTSDDQVHLFTSHRLAGTLFDYWKKTGNFHADYCCYRYVEGIRNDDPDGLVLLYYREPTRWECSSHKRDDLGRPVSFHPPQHSWEFLPEAEFQKRLTQTMDYLQKQGRLNLTNEWHSRATR